MVMLEAILSNLINESLESDPMATTMVAANLNYTMARNPKARADYARIYGVEWTPLGNGAEREHKFARPSQMAVTAKGSK